MSKMFNVESECEEAGMNYKLATKTKVSNDSNITSSVIAISSCQSSPKLIATALTSNVIQIYNDESLCKIHSLQGHKKSVTDIQFSQSQPDIMYSSSLDGTIQLWDLRLSAAVRQFKDDSKQRLKPLCSFDINCQESHLCAGTEQMIMDAFVLFWDLRNPELLGGYWDSHTDDITSVSFNSKQPKMVMTGSTDGLINIFDISQISEDDALQNTLNTESSVDQLKWCNEGERIACTTHNETLQIWDVEQVEIWKSFQREDFIADLKLKMVPSQLLGLNVNAETHKPTLALTTDRNDTILTEIDDKPLTSAILKNSSKESLTGVFWKKELNMAVTADEGAWLNLWIKN
ncbi:hypothetical protein CHUAL_011731 [Chamberlinius hualienensis]